MNSLTNLKGVTIEYGSSLIVHIRYEDYKTLLEILDQITLKDIVKRLYEVDIPFDSDQIKFRIHERSL